METRVNYIIVGAFVLLLGGILLAAAVWLSFGFNRDSYTSYLAYFNQSVNGLNVNSAVRYNGVAVGYVGKIDLVPKNPQTVRVTLRIHSSVFVDQTTIATLQAQGITGLSAIDLYTPPGPLRPLTTLPGQEYPVIATAPSFSLNSLGDRVRSLLSPENIHNVTGMLQNLHQVTQVMANNSEKLNEVIINLNRTAAEMPATIKSVKDMSMSVNQAGQEVSLTMQNGRVVLQGLADQAMPETVLALGELRQLLTGIQQLNNLLQEDPAVLLRGRVPPQAGPGEASQ